MKKPPSKIEHQLFQPTILISEQRENMSHECGNERLNEKLSILAGGGHLGDKNALIIELRLDHFLIKGFGVELVAWSSFNRVSQISHYNVIFLLPHLKLHPESNNSYKSKHRKTQDIYLYLYSYLLL